MRQTAIVLLLTLVRVSAGLWAQTDLLDPGGSIDDLFGDPDGDAAVPDGSVETPDSAESEGQQKTNPEDEGTELVDLVRGSSVSLGGNFNFSLGYTAGWTNVPWLVSSGGGTGSGSGGSTGGFRQGALTDTRSLLSLNFRIAPEFRVTLSFKFEFPTFKTEVSEFFADYTLLDTVYFRVGRHTINWGISRFHPHTNLTARLPDAFPVAPDEYDDEINDADSYAFRASVPIGTGGLEFIGFTRNGFMTDPSSPKSDDIGWGGTYNLAVPFLDLTMGTFYHQLLDWRSYLSLSTTLFKRLEFYSEGLIAFQTGSWDFNWGANAGFLLGFWKDRIQWSGEYYYTTETRDLRVKSTEYPLIQGHNIAGGVAFFAMDEKLRFYTQVQYNANENTGLLIPALTWDALPFVTITAASPWIFGTEDGTYAVENPSENEDRKISFVLMAFLRASF